MIHMFGDVKTSFFKLAVVDAKNGVSVLRLLLSALSSCIAVTDVQARTFIEQSIPKV